MSLASVHPPPPGRARRASCFGQAVPAGPAALMAAQGKWNLTGRRERRGGGNRKA
eukprot:CAMPEP_0203927464 /NCGR_PEP_ID=MMETSP0359-20131031/66877_1 /ASSEMBLY_ACC=CAM_ASM_000338 /TAXON_ID=268821 /ORGANISM="Scrippsiella Hangoei, Strain SHTV-5" /LENGTH=54 /DNA_ID=CAMNT_0050856235 /DNA_START=25 /DNA_END=186 /DNA_ORIENTATION=-